MIQRKQHGSGCVARFICTACLSTYLGEMAVEDQSCPRCGGILWLAGLWDLKEEGQPGWWKRKGKPQARATVS